MTYVTATIPGLLLLAVVGAITARSAFGRVVVYGGSMAFCAGVAVAGFEGLTNPIQHLLLPIGLPWIGTHLRLDALSGFFLIIVGLGGAAASLFALGYGRHEEQPERVLPFYPAFLAGMTLVVVADDAFVFLFAWELMSLTSWGLVLAHHREPGNRRAGFVYLIMATFSGLALLLAFGLLAGAQGGYAFDTMRDAPPGSAIAAVVLIVALIGAGSKAGLAPLHVWLPLAHPAAPSHVSALMSGVMTKVAIYGFIRIVFDLLGPTQWWDGLRRLAPRRQRPQQPRRRLRDLGNRCLKRFGIGRRRVGDAADLAHILPRRRRDLLGRRRRLESAQFGDVSAHPPTISRSSYAEVG